MLIADDDELMRFWLQDHLEQQGYDVTVVATGDDAVKACQKKDFDYVFLDLLMPGGMEGSPTCCRIKELNPNARIIIITAFAKSSIPEDCLKNAHALLRKPFGIEDLSRAFAGDSTEDA